MIRTVKIRSARDFALACALGLAISMPGSAAGDTVPSDGMIISADTSLVQGVYNLPNGLTISSAGVTLDCQGAVLTGQGAGAGITVNNSNVTVKNCQIENYNVGISLPAGHSYNTLLRNKLTNAPIKLDQETFALLEENSVTNPGKPCFDLGAVTDSIFVGNTALECAEGFWLHDVCSQNQFEENSVTSCTKAFFLEGDQSDSLFVRNTTANCQYGFVNSGDLTDNEFAANTVRSNDYGIALSGATSNKIHDNHLAANNNGVQIASSSSNRLWLNAFCASTVQQASDNQAYDYWYDVSVGNRWSDYDQAGEGCLDIDYNGYCDSPRLVPTSTAKDYYALASLEDSCPVMTQTAGVYQITSCCQLRSVGSSGSYALANDLDCSESVMWNNGGGFSPIPSAGGDFSGVLDGQNFKITGISINLPAEDDTALLRGIAADGEVKNLTLQDHIVVGRSRVAGLAAVNQGAITNCFVDGTIDAAGSLGGGVSAVNMGTIAGSFSAGTVSVSGDQAGGVAADNYGTISGSWSRTAVSAAMDEAGGLAGFNEAGALISDSYSAAGGLAAGVKNVGGLLGTNDNGAVDDSYATVPVSGETMVGGVAGNNDGGVISRASYAGDLVFGQSAAAGGLAGGQDSFGTISACFFLHAPATPAVCVGQAAGTIDCTVEIPPALAVKADGAPPEAPSCSESDGGKAPRVRGRTVMGPAVYRDRCRSKKVLTEFFCDGAGLARKLMRCRGRCSRGRCRQGGKGK